VDTILTRLASCSRWDHRTLTHEEQGRLTEVGKLIEHEALTQELCVEGVSYLDSSATRLSPSICVTHGPVDSQELVTLKRPHHSRKLSAGCRWAKCVERESADGLQGHIHQDFGRVGNSAYWISGLG